MISMLLVSCAGAKTETGRYHRTVSDNLAGAGAVAELQHESIRAMKQGNNLLAIEILQRAIKIEPRNPISWHHLAQAYRHSGYYERCIDMLERSVGYSAVGADLDRANSALRNLCLDK